MGKGEESAAEIWRVIYDKKLIFLYFGLLFFGLGAGIYNIFVPHQIRDFPLTKDYIAAMREIGTQNLVLGSFDRLADMYFSNLQGEDQSPFVEHTNVNFPTVVSDDFHRLVREAFLRIDEGVTSESEPEPESGLVDFWTGTGEVMTDNVLNLMYAGNRLGRQFKAEIQTHLLQLSKDVFYTEHRALDFSQAGLRVVTFAFYLIGLLLLGIPTFATSVIILGSL